MMEALTNSDDDKDEREAIHEGRLRRYWRPTRGSFVVIVGPDGTGKSTLARRLVDGARNDFAGVLHIHWRPGLLPRAGSLIGAEAGDPTTPHAQAPHGRSLSLALLAYDWLDFFLGTWLRIVPLRARGGLVVMERGWFDMVVDQRRYHLDVPESLVEWLGRLLPSPDLLLVLQADPQILRKRKTELPSAELSRQMARWRTVSLPRRTLRLFLDASDDPDEVLGRSARLLLRMRGGAT